MPKHIYINSETAIDLCWIIIKRIEQLKIRIKKIYKSKTTEDYKDDKKEIARLKKLYEQIKIIFQFNF